MNGAMGAEEGNDYEIGSEIPLENETLNQGISHMKQGIGNVLYNERMYNMALRFYSEAVELCPDSSSFLIKANCHMQLQQYKEALEDAKKSIAMDPNSFQGHCVIATCALALEELDMAGEILAILQELRPSNYLEIEELNKIDEVYSLCQKAVKAYKKKEYYGVIKYMDRILERLPSRKLKLRRAECLAILGQYEEANEVASNILILDKQHEDAMYVLGLCSYFEGFLDLAIRRLNRVLRTSPSHQQAKDIVEKATAIKVKNEEGLKACQHGCYRKGYWLYTHALEIDPYNKISNMQIYLKRAKVAVQLGKLNEAVEDCSAALDINRTCINALLFRAKLYIILENYEQAVMDYKTLCKINNCYEYKLLLKYAKKAMKTSKKKRTLYTILGVCSNASPDEIKYAYHKKSLLHHPDRHVNSTLETRKEQELLFKEVGRAYNILSDPQKRAAYDAERKLW